MTLNDIAIQANSLADENYSTTIIKGYVNSSIARINATLNARLPMFTDVNTDYTALSDDWITLLFIPYAAYGIKTNDGSLNEADRFRNEFEINFRLLEENRFKAIPEAYRDTHFGGIYQIDTTVGLNVGWFKK
jgi:hypothetical protein